MAIQKGLSGLRKAAIVSLLIGEEGSGEVLRHLNEDELEKLAKEVGSMKTKEPITPTTLVKNDLFLNVRRK